MNQKYAGVLSIAARVSYCARFHHRQHARRRWWIHYRQANGFQRLLIPLKRNVRCDCPQPIDGQGSLGDVSGHIRGRQRKDICTENQIHIRNLFNAPPAPASTAVEFSASDAPASELPINSTLVRLRGYIVARCARASDPADGD